MVGAGADIGSHVIFGGRVCVSDGVRVGDNCEISIDGTYHGNVATGTFINRAFESPVRLYAAQ
jgi:UDP-3-O-[3-hydroxymyristoyl] glucosamine N-acyltransferase